MDNIKVSEIIESLEWEAGYAATNGKDEDAALVAVKIAQLENTEGETTFSLEAREADDATKLMENLNMDADWYATEGYGVTKEIVRKRAALIEEQIADAVDAASAPYVPELDEWVWEI